MISNSNSPLLDFPLVTIVALCYNQAQYAEETLDSILAQTYPNIQLIIMDDASTDNSVDVIRKWIDRNQVDCTFIAHKENKGICKTLNEALELVQGDYYQAIACDDVLMKNKIQCQVSEFEKLGGEYALVYSDLNTINEKSELFGERVFFERGWIDEQDIPRGDVFYELSKLCFIAAPTVLLRTAVVKEFGYNENLYFEDWELWLKISSKYKVAVINNVLVYYRVHGKSIYQSYSKKYRDSLLEMNYSFIGFRQQTDPVFSEYVVREAMVNYINNGLRKRYWLFIRFLEIRSLKSFLQFVLGSILSYRHLKMLSFK
ncbi:MAG: glycosyltransferase family 2 protein [Breznakibacter sp.]